MKSLVVLGLAVSLGSPAFAQATHWLYSATGGTPGAIQPEVDRFRKDLGDLNPNEARSFPTGRREINWDAVGGTEGNPNLPGDFFNKTSPRGLIMSTPGSALKVSGDESSASFLMKDITLDAWGLVEFGPFSNQKFFAPLGSNITDIEFRLPGTDTIACVAGFGAVFMDLDRGGQTFMEVALTDGAVRKFLPPSSPIKSKGLAFLGVRFPNECIVSVRIRNGDHPVDTPVLPSPLPDGVGLDDFIYSEPVSIPRKPDY